MIRDDAVSRIQQVLGFYTLRATEIVNALQDAQVILEQEPELPWFLKTEVSSISTVSDEERVPVPTGFLREWEDDPLWYFDATATADADKWTELAKDDLELLRDKYPGSGSPLAYALDGKYFRIFPTPDAIYTLKMIYFKQATLLDTNVENDWLKYFPYLMIGEAGRLFTPALRDKEAIAKFTEWAAQGRTALLRANEARMHSSRRYVMGGQN